MIPFHSARLGPAIVDLAKERHATSLMFLQGGGISPEQLRRIPLPGFPFAALLRRLASGLAGKKR